MGGYDAWREEQEEMWAPRYGSEGQSYYYNYAEANQWAHPEAGQCGCRGRGWWLSEVDTWHQCPYHGKGKPHPEDHGDYDDSPPPVTPPAPLVPATTEAERARWEEDLPF